LREKYVTQSLQQKVPVVWTIGASDSSGGSGIQADLHTFHDFSVHGCTVITALNAQNSFALGDTAATAGTSISAQISALDNDMPAASIKLGAVPNGEVAAIVAEYLQRYQGLVVYDLEFESSGPLLLEQAQQIVREGLLPRSDLVVANADEVKTLCAIDVSTVSADSADSVVAAAQHFLDLGARSVLITGCKVRDAEGGPGAGRIDYWSNGSEHCWLAVDAIATANNQAGGCTLSAAIAALLGTGEDLQRALVLAKAYVTKGIRGAQKIGNGPGSVAHLGGAEEEQDTPRVSSSYPF